MSTITTPATIDAAPQQSQALLVNVQRQLGSVPNMFRIVANSPHALEGYLNFSGSLSKGSLNAQTRERIALAVAEINACGYCLAAHTYLGKNLAKLSDEEVRTNREGSSLDAKAAVAVEFAAAITATRGHIAKSDVKAVIEAGYSEAEIVEIVALVAANTLTNYFNEVLGTELDFPAVDGLVAA